MRITVTTKALITELINGCTFHLTQTQTKVSCTGLTQTELQTQSFGSVGFSDRLFHEHCGCHCPLSTLKTNPALPLLKPSNPGCVYRYSKHQRPRKEQQQAGWEGLRQPKLIIHYISTAACGLRSDTTRATRNSASMLDSNCEIIVLQNKLFQYSELCSTVNTSSSAPHFASYCNCHILWDLRYPKLTWEKEI